MRELVIGSTGTVGSALIAELVRRDIRAVAATRNPSRHTFPAGVEKAAFDHADDASVQRALVGVDGMFVLAPPGMESQVERWRGLFAEGCGRRARRADDREGRRRRHAARPGRGGAQGVGPRMDAPATDLLLAEFRDLPLGPSAAMPMRARAMEGYLSRRRAPRSRRRAQRARDRASAPNDAPRGRPRPVHDRPALPARRRHDPGVDRRAHKAPFRGAQPRSA